jgi:hypothetical protein
LEGQAFFSHIAFAPWRTTAGFQAICRVVSACGRVSLFINNTLEKLDRSQKIII